MLNRIKDFIRQDCGAISVDWVVLTAGMVILATAVGVSVRDGALDGGEDIQAYVESHITE